MINQEIQNKICSVVGLTADEYSMFVFDTGIEYLELRAQVFATCVSKTTSFWVWYKRQFMLIDEIYLEKTKPLFGYADKDMLQDIWAEEHSPRLIQQGISMVIWNETNISQSYGHMLHSATKEVANTK